MTMKNLMVFHSAAIEDATLEMRYPLVHLRCFQEIAESSSLGELDGVEADVRALRHQGIKS